MLLTVPKLRKRPWVPWVRFCLVLALVALAGWGALELGQRYLGIQKLVIAHVDISGCLWGRQSELQAIADEFCMGKPLFLFDAGELQSRINSLRWVKASLIRREPPDRLSIVIDERQPLLMLATDNGVLLMSEDGVIMGRVDRANLTPLPVVADPDSMVEETLVKIVRAARVLKAQQPEFFARLSEMRWGGIGYSAGPVVYYEDVHAPIYLSKDDPAKNIPNFQALFLRLYANRPDLSAIRYFDLCWDNRIAVGELPRDAPPQVHDR